MTDEIHAVGVDVGGTKISVVGVDQSGEVRARVELSTPVEDVEAAFMAIGDAVRTLSPGRPVGVGVPGLVDDAGVMHEGANVSWRDVPVRARLAELLDSPVVVENDCTAGAYGEWRSGAGAGTMHLLYVGVGTGIGGGLVLGGTLYRGANGFAGEVGHVVVEPDGERCGCGNRGCWETVASGSAITRDGRRAVTRHPHSVIAALAEGDPDRVTGEMVTEAAKAGDPTARGILAEVGTRLGIGIAGLVNALDPQVVVVGGGVVEAGDLVLAPAAAACANSVERDGPDVPIRAAALGADSAAVGAALLAVERR